MEFYSGDSLNYFKINELSGKTGTLEITEDSDCTVIIFHCDDGNAYVIDIKYRSLHK